MCGVYKMFFIKRGWQLIQKTINANFWKPNSRARNGIKIIKSTILFCDRILKCIHKKNIWSYRTL